jgi:hypothetical protein
MKGSFRILGLFKNEDAKAMSGRIRACIDSDYFQDILFLAAKVKKTGDSGGIL